jgi:hypothetical protein
VSHQQIKTKAISRLIRFQHWAKAEQCFWVETPAHVMVYQSVRNDGQQEPELYPPLHQKQK